MSKENRMETQVSRTNVKITYMGEIVSVHNKRKDGSPVPPYAFVRPADAELRAKVAKSKGKPDGKANGDIQLTFGCHKNEAAEVGDHVSFAVVLDKHGRYEARNLKKLEETEPNEPKVNKPMVKSTYIDPALKTAIAVGMAEQSQDYDFEDVLEDDDFNETYKDYLDDEDLHKERKRK